MEEQTCISFTVFAEPRGKERPKFSRRSKSKSGKPGVYTPKETVNYEEKVKDCVRYVNYILQRDIPLEFSVKAYYKIPKSVSKKTWKQMLDEEILPVKKPDHDNVLKIISDALNKELYEDDAQINESHFKKVYGDPPRVEIKVGVVEPQKKDTFGPEPTPKRQPTTQEIEEALRNMGKEWSAKRGIER